MMTLLYVLVIVCNLWTFANGAKILAVFSMGAHSHFTLGFRLAKELADKGHDVTFINAYPQKTPIKNLREISVAEITGDLEEQKKGLYDMGQMSYLGQLGWVAGMGYFYTENVLKVEGVQRLLKSDEKFDIVLMEHFMNEAMFIFAHKFNCPLVLLAPGPPTVFNNHLFANPSPSSYVPNLLSAFDSHMTLWERLINTYYDVVGELYVHNVMLPKQEEILKAAIPGAPDLENILYNASLMLLTSHVSLRDPVPLQVNVKEIGGYHVGPIKPLQKDLQQFLDDAKDGVVVFSMGSNLKSAHFPQKKKDAVLKAFSKIKQKVLWKFEEDLPGKPKNVKIMKWLPQQDVLAHPNVIAFITHVGLLGTIEAVYHGVPLLGLPVYWDQEKNIQDAVLKGYGLSVPYAELNEDNFEWALTEIINNPKYRENAKMRSKIMHDNPVKQLDEAVFWIEYVVRHRGAPHLKSAGLKLKWYQRYLIDIIFVLTTVTVTLLATIIYICKFVLSSKSSKTKKD